MASSDFDIQYKLLYYPDASVPSKESLRAINLQFWPSEDPDYRGFVSNSDHSGYKGTVVIFHGNAGTAADRSYYVKALFPLGYRILLAEYPGYGARNGKLGELSLVDDARETVMLAFKQYGEPIYLLGESLGCGVTAAMVKDLPIPVKGILLITPWDTLLSVAKDKFPFFPVRWLLKDKYDSISNLKGFKGNIAVMGAEHDEVIPIRHANALYRSLSGSKRKWIMNGVGHNDWLISVDTGWWHEVMGFVSETGKCLGRERRRRGMESMQDKRDLLEGLRQTPKILSDFVRAVPEDKMNLQRGDDFWTIAEHVIHLAQVQPMLLERFQRFLDEDHPEFVPYIPSDTKDKPVIHSSLDVTTAIKQYAHYRYNEIVLLEGADDMIWQKIGTHPEYEDYSLKILVRHVLLHDYWHMYRMEQLWLTRDAYLPKV